MIKKINSDISPLQMYNNIRKKFKYTALLESLDTHTKMANQSIICFKPKYILKYTNNYLYKITDDHSELVATGYNKMKEYLKYVINKYPDFKSNKFFTGGLVGFTSYDLIKKIEKIPCKHEDIYPDLLYAFYEDAIIFDHLNQSISIQSLSDKISSKYKILDNLIDFEVKNKVPIIANMSFDYTKNEFENMVDTIKNKIINGEIFQTVLSQTCRFNVETDHFGLYLRIREINPSPYMYCLEFDDYTVIGSSPELLIAREKDKLITYPIAGTRKLGTSDKENNRIADELLSDVKERAEHNMLVDLARNDLAKVSKIGSVKVDDYGSIKYFSHVMHIVSRVVSELDSAYHSVDAFFSLFPAGTVTGAPKIRAIELINQFEKFNRGPYAGAVGYFEVSGNMQQAIAIRSIFGYKNNFTLQAGAGIVYDSLPEREYEETINKMEAFFKVLKLELIN